MILLLIVGAQTMSLYRDVKYDLYRTSLVVEGSTLPMIIDINSQYSTIVCQERCDKEPC
jgi:hypothetical protein